MRVYFDPSAILPLLADDAHTRVMREWYTGAAFQLTLSDFAAAEFGAAVSRGVRIGRLTARAAEETLADFDQWRLQTRQRHTSSEDMVACERLVRDFRLKLNAPHALHLAIARGDDVPLVTFDQRLAAAARAVNHRVIIPGE